MLVSCVLPNLFPPKPSIFIPETYNENTDIKTADIKAKNKVNTNRAKYTIPCYQVLLWREI